MTATSTRARPPYLRLVNQEEPWTSQAAMRVTRERGSGDDEVVIITVPRNAGVLRELHARMGRQLSLRRVAPDELTFAVRDIPMGGRNSQSQTVRLLPAAVTY